jgi:phytoene dehydrogenase-like protein
MTDFDDLVIGTGMAGLTVGALLATSGRRVLLLEAHDAPGGYAHTFRMRDYRFCAQVHYIFNCGEGESVHAFLTKLGVAHRVPFVRLDPEGFDHVVIAGERVRIPNGLAKYRDRLVRRFPEAEEPVRRYFELVAIVGDELRRLGPLPERLTPALVLRSAWRFRHVLRYLRATLGEVYDELRMPRRLRAILSGQCGDYLLPPRDVSFLLHVALVEGYDRGAYYPKGHYFHLIETIVDSVRQRPGCAVLLSREVTRIQVEAGRVAFVATRSGERFTARRYISNVDPKVTGDLVGVDQLDARSRDALRYEYSAGTITLYLGLRGLDLRDHGFGSFNVWHYPHDDLERIYDNQLLYHDLSNPWLFLSTPTLHSGEPGLCPAGDQILEVATACDYTRLARLRQTDRRAYNAEKKKIRETILDVVEQRYVPKLRDHLVLRLTGTPATNERFCRAPAGNAYGAALTPRNVGLGRRPTRTSLENLWMVNATAGFPSVAGTVGAGIRLYEDLSGDRV